MINKKKWHKIWKKKRNAHNNGQNKTKEKWKKNWKTISKAISLPLLTFFMHLINNHLGVCRVRFCFSLLSTAVVAREQKKAPFASYFFELDQVYRVCAIIKHRFIIKWLWKNLWTFISKFYWTGVCVLCALRPLVFMNVDKEACFFGF